MASDRPSDLRTPDGPPVGTRVVESVAQAESADPLELDRPLYEAIDTDALDRLCSADTTVRTVTFTYLGYEITVQGDGKVSICEPSE